VTPEPRRACRAALLFLAGCSLALLPALSTEPNGAGVVAAPAAERAAAPLDPPARRALLDTYAPVVLLADRERALPAHAEWYLAQARILLGRKHPAARRAWVEDARLLPLRSARDGSPDAADWTTYGHVYRAGDGGVLLQYWFFYPYNRFHGFGDHEADWEHVTLRLGPDGRPQGAWYARHGANAPGVWSPWSKLAREGSHPVVLAASGSHASYASEGEVPWYESVCPTSRPQLAADLGCRVWRTWSGTSGGVVDLGSRDRPGVAYLLWPGRWGAEGGIADDGAGPPGPAFQPGWCSRGAAGCR
jgi:hypothetical protein